jgi:hypothetical protein
MRHVVMQNEIRTGHENKENATAVYVNIKTVPRPSRGASLTLNPLAQLTPLGRPPIRL